MAHPIFLLPNNFESEYRETKKRAAKVNLNRVESFEEPALEVLPEVPQGAQVVGRYQRQHRINQSGKRGYIDDTIMTGHT